MRFLAIDAGGKRTGLAVGDDRLRLASPVGVIVTANPRERLRQVLAAVEDQGPDALVLGLPLNMDDSEGPAAQAALALARELARAAGLAVHLVDERLSSDAADQVMARSGLTHGQKKARRDALAAAAILADFFERGSLRVVPPGDAGGRSEETGRGRQGDRETGRQGDRETGRQGDRETG